MQNKTRMFKEAAARQLANTESREFLNFFLPVLVDIRAIGLGSFSDMDGALEAGREIRKSSVSRLGELLERFEENAKANGAKIYWAKDAEAANEYVLDLINAHEVPFVTKGKSMITEEIGLNEALVANGTEVFETDLGEFIIQLLGCPPFHIIGPAMNIPVDEISRIFVEKGVIDEPSDDPTVLGIAARHFLREKFEKMKLGITGVNMAIAESGSILNIENEGNIRFNKSSPEIQVSIMSLEKVVETLDEAMHMARVISSNGTGQKLSGYVSIDSGPRKEGELDGPKELHIVILDNGRSGIYENPKTREVLQCVRCGACINICPVFRQIGGYPYGWAYTGPIGTLLNPLFLGLEDTKDLFGACTLCKGCKSVCPGGIDHPSMIHYYRELAKRKGSLPETLGAKAMEFGAKHPSLWHTGASMARGRINAEIGKGQESKRLAGWMEHRDLPEMPEESYRDAVKKGEGGEHG